MNSGVAKPLVLLIQSDDDADSALLFGSELEIDRI